MSLPDAPWAQDPGKKEAILTFCSNEVWRSVLTSLAQMHQKKKKSFEVYPNVPKTLSSEELLDKNLAYDNFLGTLAKGQCWFYFTVLNIWTQ